MDGDFMLEDLTYPAFLNTCENISKMSDKDILKHFPDVPAAETRLKYSRMFRSTTHLEFEKFKSARNVTRHKNHGNVLYAAKQNKEAIEEYESALASLGEIADPALSRATETTVRLNLALAYLEVHLPQSVIQECKRVLEIDPYNDRGIYRISRAYLELEQPDMARAYLKRAVILQSTDPKRTRSFAHSIP